MDGAVVSIKVLQHRRYYLFSFPSISNVQKTVIMLDSDGVA